tara:strand:- start:2732 stop:3178 length:447 start_codon:yes stop_codon:yes gene_type:complete
MKKHKFKLAAVLKLREAKEKKVKSELGEIVQEIQRVKERLQEIDNDVDVLYSSQEQSVQTPAAGRMIRFYPEAVRGLKADKVATENLLSALERRYQRKVEELKVAMGETKVMNKLKEKDFAAHKKQVMKKELETLEEIIMLRPKENSQ